jgi:hypothetical protein
MIHAAALFDPWPPADPGPRVDRLSGNGRRGLLVGLPPRASTVDSARGGFSHLLDTFAGASVESAGRSPESPTPRRPPPWCRDERQAGPHDRAGHEPEQIVVAASLVFVMHAGDSGGVGSDFPRMNIPLE